MRRERGRETNGCRRFCILSIASGGDVQNELEGLGVNVFDQGTFEEGVMKQLDEEVARHTVKQRQRFLVEEYSRVKQERKLVYFSKCTHSHCIFSCSLSLQYSSTRAGIAIPKNCSPSLSSSL